MKAEPRESEQRQLAFERLLFFSDAVFAIAITLLVLDLKPELLLEHGFDLRPLLPALAGCGLSFYVVGRYWIAHHDLFTGVRTYSPRLLTANLCFLAFIAFLPFPTRVVIEAKATTGPVVFYCLSLAGAGVSMTALTALATRPELAAAGETRGGAASHLVNALAAPLVFALSALVAIWDAGRALWLLLLLFPVSWAAERLGATLKRRLDRATTAPPTSSRARRRPARSASR